MLKIRLQRVGRKHEPVFRLVLTDSKNSTKSGKYLESLGSYDARRGEKSEIKKDRVEYWMSKGAQVSGTVHNILVDKKVVSGKKVNVLPLKKAIVKDIPPVEAPVSSVPPEPTPTEASTTEITPETPVVEAPLESPVAETTSEAVTETSDAENSTETTTV